MTPDVPDDEQARKAKLIYEHFHGDKRALDQVIKCMDRKSDWDRFMEIFRTVMVCGTIIVSLYICCRGR